MQIRPAFRLVSSAAMVLIASALSAGSPSGLDRALILEGEDLEIETGFARELESELRRVGYQTERIDGVGLPDRARLSTNRYDLLVVPDGRGLPADAAPALESFLREGGDLVALGLPLWESPRFRVAGRWLTRDEYHAALSRQTARHVLADFDDGDLASWSRATDQVANPVHHSADPEGRGRALHILVERLTGWETYRSPQWISPFPEGHTLTCFRARGGATTRQLSVEWTERDGSRWIAVVDLAPEWRSYALPPAAFKAWLPPAGRAGAGDHLSVSNAAGFAVGLAFSHTAIEGSHQEYWFDDLGTAPNPFGREAPPTAFQPPRLESLCPGYQLYPVSTRAVVRPSHEKVRMEDWESQDRVRELEFMPDFPLRAIHPRPRGIGFGQGRPWRWEPLLGAFDPDNADYRGALGALLVHARPPYRGSLWAGFTPAEPEFYRQPLVRQALRQVLERIRRGVFLLEAGPAHFTSVPAPSAAGPAGDPQAVRAGACLVNFGRASIEGLSGTVGEFTHGNRAGEGMAFEWTGDCRSEAFAEFELPVRPGRELPIGFAVLAGRQVLDALESPVMVWEPTARKAFVGIVDGHFAVGGQPWRAHGVNYLPSSGIGLADGNGFEHWLGRGAYDPSVVQRDLTRIRRLGLNAVSVFIYHRSLDAGHLYDFLRRCEEVGLRVNLSLRPGTPMDFRWTEMRALIEHYRLASNATVFAYDLAWEPSHFDEAYQRKRYPAEWLRWVLARHGSTVDAEAAWGHPLAPDEAAGSPAAGPARPGLAVPPMRWLTRDGPWRRIAADYRAFLDDLVRRSYAEARRLVRSVDAVHPVSFRMQFAGDPTFNAEHLLPYDFAGLADAVDLWEPEAYGRIGDWERVRPGQFTAAYARLCDPLKPVMWAEMGFDVWDRERMSPQPGKLAFAARYYRDFYRMLAASGADGVFFWWYPGGYRLNEQSDYGILSPDGTDRDLSLVIRAEGPRFLAAPGPRPPDFWITVDRDRDARGLVGLYEAAQTEFWKAVDQGRTPGLRWADQPAGQSPSPALP